MRHEESMWSPQAESPRIGMIQTVGAAHRLGFKDTGHPQRFGRDFLQRVDELFSASVLVPYSACAQDDEMLSRRLLGRRLRPLPLGLGAGGIRGGEALRVLLELTVASIAEKRAAPCMRPQLLVQRQIAVFLRLGVRGDGRSGVVGRHRLML